MQVPVLLRKDITGIGRLGETVEVSERFAKNVLFRHGLAELARRNRAKPDGKPAPDMRESTKRRRREAEALERALSRVRLTFPIHIGEDGRPKELAINAEEVAEALIEEHELFVDPDAIRMPPVRKLGPAQAEIQLEGGGRTRLTLNLVADPSAIRAPVPRELGSYKAEIRLPDGSRAWLGLQIVRKDKK